MRHLNKNQIFDTVSFLAGCLLPFAFAPFYLFIIAPIAVALLLWTWLQASPRRAAFRGLLFGIGSYGVGVSWVFISIHRFGNTAVPLALLFTAGFILVLASLTSLQGYLFNRLYPKNGLIKLLGLFPALWVLFEWIRGWLFTGFPWLYLGYSQTNSPLKGYAPLIGNFGVSFIVAFSAALLVVMILKFRSKRTVFISLLSIISIWLLGFLLSFIAWTQPTGKPITVSLIQGNIPQELKWSSTQVTPTLMRYKILTERNWTSDLVVWPEAAVPTSLFEAQGFLSLLSLTAEKHRTSIILGIPIHAGRSDYYNAAMVIGSGHGIYKKRALVPFGEYLPLDNWLRGLINFFDIPMSDFMSGEKTQPLLIANHIKIAPFICYEIAYSSLVRHDLPEAQLLLTISNDAWFGDSFAAAQHTQIAQMRSLEAGRYSLFLSNNGITATIKPNGEIQKTIPRFKTAVLTDQVIAMSGETPWIRFGDWPILVLIGLLIGLGVIFCRRPAA